MSRTRLLGIIMMACLPLMAYTCYIVPIKDGGGRKKTIKNVANSVGQQIFLKRIENLKKDIEETEKKHLALQDSINESLFRSFTVKDLKFAQINTELKDVQSIENSMSGYLSGTSTNSYTETLISAYGSDNLNQAAADFISVLSPSGGLSAPLTKDAKELKNMVSGRLLAQNDFWEFADKRALQTASVMKNWSDVYSKKAAELSQLLLKDNEFTMTDFERISLTREAEKYATLSYTYIEKSDSILLSVKENEFKHKKKAENALNTYNNLKNYYGK